MNTQNYGEDALVERPAIELLGRLGWETLNAYSEVLGEGGTLGRDNQSEVVLSSRLRTALKRLNPHLDSEVQAAAIQLAIDAIVRDRSTMDRTRANREVWKLLREGVTAIVRRASGASDAVTVRLIDWNEPRNNDFLLVSQLWIVGDLYRRRTDLVGFVNGIPLLFVELKASHRSLKLAYMDNLRDYRDTIPRLFDYNQLVVLSNGRDSKMGTVSSQWEHFSEWRYVESENEKAATVSLERMLRGVATPERLLDLSENFIVFQEKEHGLIKLAAKNHQYLGVNATIERLDGMTATDAGRLGVFWHTQGSGKTVSMMFLSQKILRKKPGNWSFVIVTDRDDLDKQAYREFQQAGIVHEPLVRARSADHLKSLLSEDHRYVFTLIQKFRTERGGAYPELSARNDVIVMVDEAHRSQYDTLALNMRNALPNARFVGFTGTPLMAGEELTREVFGNYVSVYDYHESIRDGATVPLYYENRTPELQLDNESFGEDFQSLVDDAALDEDQERALRQHFGREYHLITRDERLDLVADDVVEHFLGRGFFGKAMVVSIDKAAAVRMYDKVKKRFEERIAAVTAQLRYPESLPPADREALESQLRLLTSTDMAVVVSQSQNEMADMRALGLDILSHRKRMLNEDLQSKFKDPADSFRLAFVCAMWSTGFDVPSCSTIYLDKPLKNHTLLQTITRANRVYPGKENGLIVDYVGVFARLREALALYTPSRDSGDGIDPIQEKGELVELLAEAEAAALAFCKNIGVDLNALIVANGFDVVSEADRCIEHILMNDMVRIEFLTHERVVNQMFKAVLPDTRATEFGEVRAALHYLAKELTKNDPKPDISEVVQKVDDLLDRSVAANAYVIRAPDTQRSTSINLSEIDFEVLVEKFARSNTKRTEIDKLRSLVLKRIALLAVLNPTRRDWLERFQEMIDKYNAGSLNIQEVFDELVKLSRSVREEEQRAVREGLTEEELAIYDLLLKPAPDLTARELQDLKLASSGLLTAMKRERLVVDWRKRQQSRAAVRVEVESQLDRILPRSFSVDLYKKKCDAVYQHIFESYFDDGSSVYATAA
ncbi:type I restriction endonuclease subunit R [Cryobacterium sp. RTC2.1]|uniref:type I restriction endonuclease subunit R n=1 Tax=Cryobacterium sp. RTC2.1 TaxID=3048634 RepID=UPI002B22A084|nr:type I restriction endonuclease subunit R [Cryobacterium sp. RTC2.1]MEB0003945.1 type I restriction endonuclease subunit R [Cryobacterium sp. RTC2.1]